MNVYDSIVIGGGPAGMTAALYLVRSGARIAMVEKLAPGGQVLNTEMIENYPGFPEGLMGYQLADLFAKHLEAYELDRVNDEVRAMEVGDPADGYMHRVLVGGDWLEAKSVILCTGSRYKRLGLPGEKEFEGKGVSFCALCDGNFYRDKDVAVIGGGNSALEESLYLAKLVNKLYLIHRRDDFRGAQCYQDKCFVHPKITTLRSSVVKSINGDASGVTGVDVENLKTGDVSTLDVSGVFLFVGFEPVHGFLPDTFELDDKGFVITDQECRTPMPGIFAAGDVRSKLTRQVTTAVGDGANAASACFSYLEQL